MKSINKKTKIILSILFVLASLTALIVGIQQVRAHAQTAPTQQGSPLHPTFALLDANGENVLTSNQPISTLKTCGQCHDTDYIATHSFHANLGLSGFDSQNEKGESWDSSNGIFGKWDPLSYRYLSQTGDERLDLTTADWLKLYGARVPGSGPATTARDGQALITLTPNAKDPETATVNSKTGQVSSWDWSQSGTMELDCFLCHLEKPNNDLRVQTISAGKFGWANTATLVGTGIVTGSGTRYTWNTEAFSENGELKKEYIQLQDPTNSNCGTCHGTVHTDMLTPLTLKACDTNAPQTATTGQVIAAQKISNSGLNIADKNDATRAWDIHAERALKCTDCHYSLNNPAYAEQAVSDKPSHLLFDPRKLEIGEYLQSPNHNFARGQSAQFTVAPELKGTMRRCETCHDAQKTHADWLPYTAQHMQVVACESCHIPQMYAPAIQTYDWTVITTSSTPRTECRGIEGTNAVTDLVTGFKPVLMQRTNVDGQTLLAPYNLITSYFWVYDDAKGNTRPVRLIDLQAAYLQNNQYAPEIVAALDMNENGSIELSELALDTTNKVNAVAARLGAVGLINPRIEGRVQPYSINHDVARGEYAIRDCNICHTNDSRIAQPLELSSYTPSGVTPSFVSDSNVAASGTITKTAGGALMYEPINANDKLYIFGHDRVSWIDWFGALFFVGVLAGVTGHGTLRYVSSLKRPKTPAAVKSVYMYEVYERFWHWLQTFVIVVLLFTGLIIHRPDIFGIFSFPHMVTIHNVLAAVLALNAALSLFYHLTTGKIHQFIPRPYGFFDEAIVQARFYMQGIFKGEAHPFGKTPEKKMNPLQQVTYFGILNVLLPLQGLTGILMWGAQKWPQIAEPLGGLNVLAPFHTLIAWTFAAFIVGHVYLTTTGATPLEAMRGMITGYEEVETSHDGEQTEAKFEPASGTTAEAKA